MVGACDISTPSIRPIPSVVATASPTPLVTDDSPFQAMAYPGDGNAPCGQPEAPDARHAPYRGNLKRIVARDATTVVFELCEPDVAFLAKVASPAFGINDTAWLRDRTSEVDGTGPFDLERWTPGSEISLSRNDGYWGSPATAERVIVRWDDDPAERSAALQGGSVDGVDLLDLTGVTELADDVSVELMPRAGMNVLYLGFGVADKPLAEEGVRRAIAQGLDRRRIAELTLPAGSDVASHVTPCEIPHGCAGPDWYDHDPSLARETLDTAGFPDGFATTLHYPMDAQFGVSDPAAVAEEIRTQLAEDLGITVELVPEADEGYLTEIAAGTLGGLSLAGREATVPDVSVFLDQRFSGGSADITKALAAGAATASDDKRETAYASANAGIRSHVPVVPIAHIGSMAAFRDDVDGVTTSPLHLERFAPLGPGDRRQFVWMTSAEPTGLDCPEAIDPTALLVCSQMVESLYAYEPAGAAPVPRLAEACSPSKDLRTWTCDLRPGITFRDGSRFDADDVVLSFASQWDLEHPLHDERTGPAGLIGSWFGGFLNPPPATD
jgi:peptide/nickel transport system substrate-binding protein